MNTSDYIQSAAVLAAVGAAIIALVISAKDRRNAREIAAEDRREALRQSYLLFELDALRQLSENRQIGGSADRVEAEKMGAEAGSLVGLIGRERIPRQWDDLAAADDGLLASIEDPEMPHYRKQAIETQLAINAVVREIQASMTRDVDGGRVRSRLPRRPPRTG